MTNCVRWLRVLFLALIVAACGGGGGSSDPLAPSDPAAPTLTLDTAAGVTKTLGLAGGSLQTVGSDGTTYTLSVPPNALLRDSAITMTPMRDIGNLPQGATLAAGAHLTPEGQRFNVPVSLVVELPTPAAIPLLPFTYAGDLQDRRLYPGAVSSNRISFEIMHFSGYAALQAQTTEMDFILGESGFFPPPSPPGDQALQALVTAATGPLAPDAREDAMASALRDWMDNVIKPRVVAAQADPSDINSVKLQFELEAFGIAVRYYAAASIYPPGVPSLDALNSELRIAVRDAASHLIPALNARCDPADPELILVALPMLLWQDLAQRTGADTLEPSLERANVLADLCLQVAYDPNSGVDFPSNLQPGQIGTLSVRAGYRINDGPVQFDQPMYMVVKGASNVTPQGLQEPVSVAAGATHQQTFLWEPATTEMRIEVDTCLANPLLVEICQEGFVVRGAPSNPPPPSGTCPSYSATAAGTTQTSGDFQTGASYFQSSSVDPENVALSFDAKASSRDRNQVMATANNTSAAATATVFYTVDEAGESGAPISFVVSSDAVAEIEVGSVTATLTINNESRSDTATGSREMPLEIPVTAKHGDILKITVTVTASSSSPAGFSEGARVTTGGVGGRLIPSGLALVPVTCN